jgi:Ca2+:H+ antiporter
MTSAVYGSYLYFQLFSHKRLYETENADVQASVPYGQQTRRPKKNTEKDRDGASGRASPTTAGNTSVLPQVPDADAEAQGEAQEAAEEIEVPQLNILVTIILLVIVTAVRQTSPSSCDA